MVISLGGGFGSRNSNNDERDGWLALAASAEPESLSGVRANRAHHESDRRIGRLGGALASMMEVGRGDRGD